MRHTTPISSAQRDNQRPGPWQRTIRSAKLVFTADSCCLPSAGALARPETRVKISPLVRSAGVALAAVGCWLTSAAVYTLVRYGEGPPAPHDPSKIFVTHGPYRYCRNPMELGNFFMLLGRSIRSGSLRTAVASVVFAAATHLWVVFVEEPFLLHHFGSAYRSTRHTCHVGVGRSGAKPAGRTGVPFC